MVDRLLFYYASALPPHVHASLRKLYQLLIKVITFSWQENAPA